MGLIDRSFVFILVLSCISTCLLTITASAAEEADNAAAIRVRIHDYSSLSARQLAAAQQIVADMYGSIGVRTVWLDVSRPFEDQAPGKACGPTDLTLIILTQDMARKRMVPRGVVGYAAVSPGEVGRVAFVIYERAAEIARRASADVVTVVGTVMAHELGHLLLPSGAHSPGGLMRRNWSPTDFRHSNLRFSAAQAREIRQTIVAAAAPMLRDDSGEQGSDRSVGLRTTSVD